VERVPLSGEPSEAEIGEDEVRVPLTDEEVRVRKDVVEDTEMVEEDVRREEIDVEDETTRRVS
jgi:stress response protein YsnF